MRSSIEIMMSRKLSRRQLHGNMRILNNLKGSIDFSSNDYLGLSRRQDVIEAIIRGLQHPSKIGSTASRLSSGNSELAEELEQMIASFHGAENGLLFTSGYQANIGLLSCLLTPKDRCLFDEGVHMSLREGIKLSKTQAIEWSHNSLDDLEEKLANAPIKGHTFVVAESVYSCDGSLAPLDEIASLCTKHKASLIVDEAHATGIFGPQGVGLTQTIRTSTSLLATVHTFGKAIGVCGAIVLGSSLLKSFLLNHCHSQIYTTMLPYPVLHAIREVYRLLPLLDGERSRLKQLICYFTSKASLMPLRLIPSRTPIQSILTGSRCDVRNLSQMIQHCGFDVRPMTFPTVAKGKERLRICLHAFNTEEEVDALLTVLTSYL